MAAGVVLFRRAGLDWRWCLLPGLVGWQMLGLLGAYVAGRNEIQWWIGTSLDRILAGVAPLALLGPAVLAGAWAAARESQEAARLTAGGSSRNLRRQKKPGPA